MRLSSLFVCATLVMTCSLAQSADENQSAVLSEQEALTLVRVIITNEITISATQGSFVPLDKLLEHPSFKSRRSQITAVDSTSGTTKGYRLSVIAAADGKHFQVALIPEQSCQTALFGSETGIIHKGRALGCTTAP